LGTSSTAATVNTNPSSNFAFLAHHDQRLVALATQAEEHFAADPTVSLFKLRQFGEVLAKRAAAKVGLFLAVEESQQARPTLGTQRHRRDAALDLS
jgi:type I restriction enzyme R subunit